MKKIIILFALLLSNTQLTFGQDLLEGDPKKSVEENAIEYTKYLKNQLVLTGKQEVLVRKNMTEYYMNLDELKSYDLTNENYNDKFATLQENNINRMRNILRQKQYDKYIKLVEEQIKMKK